MTKLMIYGATGYTGRMAAAHARKAGLPLILAGRTSAIVDLAEALQAEPRVFGLDDEGVIDAALSDVGVLLNCAGPFMHTAEPLMRAAIRNGVHYLDIAAELDSYRLAEELDAKALAAGVMLLPGSGGSVAMLGCLAGHAAGRVTRPQKIAIALHVSGSMSRGSAISASQNVSARTLMRMDGQLVDRPASELVPFDFGKGPVDSFPVTLPDLITIAKATGIPNIETFVHVSGDAFPAGDLSHLPDGPSAEAREANRYQAAVQVTGDNGVIVRSILDTVNGYSFTPMAAAEAARRVLAGESRPGFQTPAGMFGNGFAETIADTRIVDL
ncbi:membrane protein [Azorhizobium oxalatiphilum]|uniref:Membrane protein n=1 Tax=Azorhizobium oxalatiphilum TaxID=980631 RepID=A0A917CF27_9HYPH|nr:saccharopine dehydrogenase NADP-binding domain-containing protein [Azorhizobium oxalatiphilum]GGF85848.1 membrane protein [Azorhizobium oxalatiphilum]